MTGKVGDVWEPEGCNWAAMITPDRTLCLMLPEKLGEPGRFRTLSQREWGELSAWILDRFGTDTPPLDFDSASVDELLGMAGWTARLPNGAFDGPPMELRVIRALMEPS